MKLESLKDLYVAELQDVYDAETQITKALPKMAKAASTPELQAAFHEHLRQTEQQISRLEQIFSGHGLPARGKTCKGMQGLIEEGQEMMKEKADPSVMDAALISAAQKVEHYEIASYGTLRTFANLLGLQQDVQLLQTTLDEEGNTDKKLTMLAERLVNPDAANEVGGRR
jgi:ferritin-like metal-binding protein YciE